MAAATDLEFEHLRSNAIMNVKVSENGSQL